MLRTVHIQKWVSAWFIAITTFCAHAQKWEILGTGGLSTFNYKQTQLRYEIKYYDLKNTPWQGLGDIGAIYHSRKLDFRISVGLIRQGMLRLTKVQNYPGYFIMELQHRRSIWQLEYLMGYPLFTKGKSQLRIYSGVSVYQSWETKRRAVRKDRLVSTQIIKTPSYPPGWALNTRLEYHYNLNKKINLLSGVVYSHRLRTLKGDMDYIFYTFDPDSQYWRVCMRVLHLGFNYSKLPLNGQNHNKIPGTKTGSAIILADIQANQLSRSGNNHGCSAGRQPRVSGKRHRGCQWRKAGKSPLFLCSVR